MIKSGFVPFLAACALVSGCASMKPGSAVASAETSTVSPAVDQLDRLAEESWEWVLESDNTQRDAAGLPFIGIKDIDLAEANRDAAIAREMIARLKELEPGDLDPEREITRQFLLKFYRDLADGPANWIYDFAITPYSGVLPLTSLVEGASKRPLDTEVERAEYLLLLSEIGDLLHQMELKTRAQADADIRLPKLAIVPLRGTYRAVGASAAERLLPQDERLAGMPVADRTAFKADIEQLIERRITPRFDALLAVIGDEYEASAPDAIGLGQYRGGRERYIRSIETYTTMAMPPEELHKLGIQLSSDLQSRFAVIRDRLGFEGTQSEFHRFLDSDPQFRVAGPEELERLYREQIARIEPHISAFFGRLPKAEYDIRRIPAANESGVAFGYYEKPSSVEPKGLFRYNGANLENRGLVQAAAINFHELIPGHHFHLALQAENDALPSIRRDYVTLKLSAFNEGWAQYGANLASEMGALKDDYELYGLVATDAMMAARLVVDTGVNALGWDFEKARDYLVTHTMMSEQQASAEVLRYATDAPGQALGYKLGHLTIDRIRAHAENELGDKFDLREFHDAVLSPGAVPLDVLEGHMDRWIRAQSSQ